MPHNLPSQADLCYNQDIENVFAQAMLTHHLSSTIEHRRFYRMTTILQEDTPRKLCTGPCQRWLPATPDYFYRNGKKGLYPQCKECKRQKKKESYQKPDVHARTLASRKDFRHNPENKDRIRAWNLAWRKRPEVRSQQREYYSVYKPLYYRNPEKRARRNEQSRTRRNHPDVLQGRREYERVWSSTRRAKQRERGETYTPAQIADLLKRQHYRCYYAACGHAKFERKGGEYVYHIDHVVPLSRGGRNDISNLILACPPCNRHKHDKLPHEWPEGGRLL